MATSALLCPECGAEQHAPPGERVVVCTSCGKSSVLVGIDAVPQRMVKPVLTAEDAAKAARRWLHGIRVRELVTMRATIAKPELAILPFVRCEADVIGWLFGTKKHEDSKGNVTYTDEEIEIAEPHDEALPLCDTGETAVYRLQPQKDVPTIPFDADAAARLGHLVPALTTEQTIEERVRNEWLTAAQKGHGLHNVTDTEISIVGLSQTIVYYPFWRVSYRYGGSDFYVMVDAHTGEVAAGKAPGSFFVGALIFAAMVPTASVLLAVGLVIAGALAWSGIKIMDASETAGGGLLGAALAVATVALGAGVMLTTAGHRSMRYGGEVEGGYGVRPDAGLFDDESASAYRKRRMAERAEVEADERLRL